MPKSVKKKKEKAADFSKAKLKLGKGKQVANNAVDTSFKARSIALPGQSIVQERDAAVPSTKRRLTFDDLISQLKHYNPTTRKDAISGLRELFSEHSSIALGNLTTVLNRCVRMIGDDDASVRKALLSFFSWFIPLIPKDDLQPHAPVLLLFTTSALTHIFPEIRVDAVRFLDIFLEHIPEIIVEGWSNGSASHARRVLEGYIGLLNAGTAFGGEGDPMRATSTASVVLYPKSKLVVLASLSTFLREAIRIRDNEPSTSTFAPQTWFLASAFTSEAAFKAFNKLVAPASDDKSFTLICTEDVNPLQDGDFHGRFDVANGSIAESWTLYSLCDLDASPSTSNIVGTPSDSGNSSRSAYLSHLAATLQPTLVSTFLDCAPAAFPPAGSPSETELQMTMAVAEMTHSLYSTLLQEYSKNSTDGKDLDNLAVILGHMSPYFPFAANGLVTAKRDFKVEASYETLNLTFCELSSLLVIATSSSKTPHPPQRRAPIGRNAAKRPASSVVPQVNGAPLQVERVKSYVIHLLRGELPRGSNTQNALPHPITHATYLALAPTIWAFISTSEQGQTDELLVALLDHAIRVSSGSAVKKATVDFLGLLSLLCTDPQFCGAFTLRQSPEGHQKFQEWLLHLPKILWEVGANNLPLSETILRLLLRLSQRKSSLLDRPTCAAIRSRLVPYFTITHPTRGQLPGPFTKLPSAASERRLALDVAATLVFGMPGTETSMAVDADDSGDLLVKATIGAVGGTEDERYWNAVVTCYSQRC
ncbi:hypothetical protein BXZ70DRAFT_1063256 [Cristinia sonorae]|uniref:Pre-rRNA-processing protein n=1 Tax=Cristinia sonorae TaxID=1940300 RepID=A0A8K0XRH7_9AGAR|nr:hypothetical protein BXZ70DRAFT_1063256 [Cristinia sonorae]